MKQGGPRGRADGFTIVETLIVLAVTGLMLGLMMTYINGRQGKTEFFTGFRDVQVQLQQIINETQSGYFPQMNDLRCLVNGSNPPQVSSGDGSEQGTHDSCIFVGKVVQFWPANLSANQMITYSMVGNASATDLLGAKPVVAQPLNQTDTLHNNLQVQQMYYDGHVNQKTAALGILVGDTTGTFADTSGGGGSVKSGALQMSLYAVPGSETGVSDETAMDGPSGALNPAIPSPAVGSNIKQVGSISICFGNGSQSGTLTVGSAGGGLTVTASGIKDGNC